MKSREKFESKEINNSVPDAPVFVEKYASEEKNFNKFENISASEINEPTQNCVGFKNKSKTNFPKYKNIISGFMAVIAVAIISVAVSISNGAIKIALIDEKIGGNYYAYNLEIENPKAEEIKVIIFNDYFKKEQVLKTGNVKGMVEGLEQNTEYKIEVKGSTGFGNKTFLSQKFTTLSSDKKLETSVSASFIQKQNEDALYYTIEINDFLGYYTNFKVFLEVGEVKSEYPISNDISAQQKLSLANIKEKNFIFIITADTTKPSDIEKGFANIAVYKAKIENK